MVINNAYMFFIPLQKFHKGVSIKSNEVWESENKTEIRSVIMSLKLDYSHFSNKKIRVKCTASLFNLYSEMSEEFIGELPRERAVTAAAGYGLLGKNGDTRSQPGNPLLYFTHQLPKTLAPKKPV